jgi:ketosteroid isomerase-like protein/catechol 2,3-dioxygenase-like lactoylglutathione lyase family enzyme
MTDASHPTPRDLLTAFHRAMIALSADDLAELHAPDASYEFPLLAPGQQEAYRGREEIRAGFGAAWSQAPVRVTEIRDVVVHESIDPEVIIAEQVAAAVIAGTDRRFTVPFLLVLRARDGLIVHLRDYTSRTPLPDDHGAALSLELVTVPVSDVDRAKAFYVEQVGFSADHDHQVDENLRFVQLTPPGAACSIAIGTGLVDSPPGSLKGLQVVVEDADAACAALRDRGVDVTDVQEYPWGRFCFFSDPDGNGWSVQEPVRRN